MSNSLSRHGIMINDILLFHLRKKVEVCSGTIYYNVALDLNMNTSADVFQNAIIIGVDGAMVFSRNAT